MFGLLSTYCRAGRAESPISALDLVGLSIQRDRLIYQNCRLLMFMSLVAIYMSFFSSYVQVQGRLCFPGTFWFLSCKFFNHLNMDNAHLPPV